MRARPAWFQDVPPHLPHLGGNSEGSRHGRTGASDIAILATMPRMGIEKEEEMSGHGFRAMARTMLDEVLGVRPDLIGHQLAHAVRDPNGRAYNRTAHLPPRTKQDDVAMG